MAETRSKGTTICLGLLLLATFVGLMLLMHVDDWRRDLTAYSATMDDAADDHHLRPQHLPGSPLRVSRAVEEAAAALPGWRLESREETANLIDMQLTHTSNVVRRVEDVQVRIGHGDFGALLLVSSQSRLGVGDLGQNPRNIRDLVAAVRERLSQNYSPSNKPRTGIEAAGDMATPPTQPPPGGNPSDRPGQVTPVPGAPQPQ